MVSYNDFNELHEECGIFGAYDIMGGDVQEDIYYGLSALQHRGQESAGIAVSNTFGPKGTVKNVRDMGLVSEVFDAEKLSGLNGNIGVGHVRYSTTGASCRENTQPLVINYVKGTLALSHNGNLINADKLKEHLARTGAIFQTTTDSEVIAYIVARERLNTDSVQGAVKAAMEHLKGAYSLAIMSARKLIGVRDPWGFRPLCLGKRGTTWFFASESCALDAVDAEFVRDVEPGEIVTITKTGEVLSDKSMCKTRTAHCIFEYIYFARPDSRIDKMSVYNSRIIAGRELAKTHPADADLVTGVPDSGNVAAMGYAMESGIPYGTAFVKNSYVGRTFIKPKQSARESGVKIKLNALREAVEGKSIVMVDDSIVRGTTCARIVKMLKDAGAREVHVRISAPTFRFPCFFGTDIPESDELIANKHTVDEICDIIGADSLGFLDIKSLPALINGKIDYCDACFTGNYPVKEETEN